MPNYLITVLAIVLVFLLPGYSISCLLRLKFANFAESIFYSLSLSFASVVLIGFILGNSIGINTTTVLASFCIAGFVGAVSVGRKLWIYLATRAKLRQFLIDLRHVDPKLLLLALTAAAVAGFNWYSAIGTHREDMGEHVFWAKTIVATGRLPNYFSVEPLDQAVKFTYGGHLILAQFFLLAGLPIEEYTWITTLIGSIGIFSGVVLITLRITESKLAALIAAFLYGSAYQPYGYIQRGNLPDIAGYLLLISTLYSILRVRRTPSFSYPLGLTAVSIIPSHQLGTVILPVVVLFTISYSYIRSRSALWETLRSIFAGRIHLVFWMTMVLLAFAYAATTTYVSSSAASQLMTGNWRQYVPAVYIDPLVPGATLGLLGIAGIIATLKRKALEFMMLFGWTSALFFLTNSLLIGIPVPDPLRFLWRLTEPFAILGAIFGYLVIGRSILPASSPMTRFEWIRRRKVPLLGTLLLTTIIAVQIGALAVPVLGGTPSVFSLPPRYLPVEAFYQDDKQIGLWLATNSPSSAVITNDDDVDSTSTWVQVYSMRLHFLYRADFAAIVAPANYIQIYKSMAILYESPSDGRVPMIIRDYNITYVVAHTDEIALFASAPACFGHSPVFRWGGSALFATTYC